MSTVYSSVSYSAQENPSIDSIYISFRHVNVNFSVVFFSVFSSYDLRLRFSASSRTTMQKTRERELYACKSNKDEQSWG